MRARGFTTFEILITVGVLGLLFSMSSFALSRLQRAFAAQNVDREITNILTTAARHARHGTQGTAWGVYIPYDEVTRKATEIILFSGESYATRNTGFDRSYDVNEAATFITADMGHEIVFDYLSGATTNVGSIVISWYGQQRTLTIDANGIPIRE